MENQTIAQSIQFLQAIQATCNLIDPDQLLTGAIAQLDFLQRTYLTDRESYLLEVPKEEFIAWLRFRESYLQQQKEIELELIES